MLRAGAGSAVDPFEMFEHVLRGRRRLRRSCHKRGFVGKQPGAYVGAELIEHGGGKQEFLHGSRLLLKHLGHEEIDDVVLVARKRSDGAWNVAAALQRKRRQL